MQRSGFQLSVASMLGLVACIALNIWLFRLGALWGILGLNARFLRSEGLEVVEAADGQEGVDRFADSGPFDLLLVALNLPVFSGVEVCRRIRRIHPGQRVMVCSAAVLHDHEQALDALGI